MKPKIGDLVIIYEPQSAFHLRRGKIVGERPANGGYWMVFIYDLRDSTKGMSYPFKKEFVLPWKEE